MQVARVYNDAMNIIHYMHDKYYYEKAQMAFIDTDPRINLAYGVAGLSIAIDSLSAMRIEETSGLQECPSHLVIADYYLQCDVW